MAIARCLATLRRSSPVLADRVAGASGQGDRRHQPAGDAFAIEPAGPARTGDQDADRAAGLGQAARPRGDVGGLSAGAGSRDRNLVVTGHEQLLESDDHVEEQVAEGRQPHE